SLFHAETHSSGYIQLWLPGYRPLAHIVAWAMQTGEWPEHPVDHENHKRDDNRWINLLATTPAENMRNLGRRANNKSGVAGVYYSKELKKWRVWISEEGRNRYLGSFETKEEAIMKRKAFEAALGYHPNHGTDTANGEEPLFNDRTEIWFD
ncbi:HNH endonuclease signature motif containing protein, partial [Nitratireductor pacificus]